MPVVAALAVLVALLAAVPAQAQLVSARPADGLVRLQAAARTDVVQFRSRDLHGREIVQSGTVAIPHGTPPPGGWPVVSFFHVTTGAGDRCAPSTATADNPELERLTRSDAVATLLVRAGVVVARPDGEGIGTPGAHPYLVGASLARSQADIVRATRDLHPGAGRRWAAAGHSEGGVASLWSAALGQAMAPELDLRAAAAFAPVTRIREQVDLLRHVPVTGPGVDGLSALAALIITGAAQASPRLAELLEHGALSPAATRLLGHVEERCLAELARRDSWGGLAPAQIPGPRFAEARPLFYGVLERNDWRRAALGSLPVRVDHGALDAVAPIALTEATVLEQRSRGARITYRRWPTATHVDIANPSQAARESVAWLVEQLRR